MGQITNNEFLSSVLNAEVWKKVSDESLSMEMIEKFQDKLDWETLSQNRNILWTTAGIAKFAGKINWSDFSQYCNANILTEENKFVAAISQSEKLEFPLHLSHTIRPVGNW